MKYASGLLLIFIVFTTCGQNKTDLPKQNAEHPKLIKTIGNPRYGNVQCGLQDKAGNLWFGTTENGLYKYDGKSFRQFLVTDGLTSNTITCLLEDKDGNIWIGTQTGLCLYDGKTFNTIQIPLRKDLPPNKNHQDRNAHCVFSIMQAKNGKLWFATIDGVYTYDARLNDGVGQGKSLPTGQTGFQQFTTKEGLADNRVICIYEDKAGIIWFGTACGVSRYDGKSFRNFTMKGEHWWDNFITTIMEDKTGKLWIGTRGDVSVYDGKTFTTLTNKEGNIWLGGYDGLRRYDGKTFTNFSHNKGYNFIIEDKKGNIWTSGSIGGSTWALSRYDQKSLYNKEPTVTEIMSGRLGTFSGILEARLILIARLVSLYLEC